MNVSQIGTSNININQNAFQKREPQGTSFSDVLQGYLQDVNHTVKQSEDLSTKLAAGEIDNIHDVTIATQKAKLALDLTVTIRDKAVEAYQEMMRMQI